LKGFLFFVVTRKNDEAISLLFLGVLTGFHYSLFLCWTYLGTCKYL